MLRKKLRDPNGTVYDNNSDLDQALDDAQNEIVSNYDYRFLYDTHTDSLVSGIAEYSLPTDIAFDRIHNIRIKDSSSASANWFELKPISYDMYKQLTSTYNTQSGLPVNYALVEGGQTYVMYPEVDYDFTDGIEIYYLKKPTALTTSADTETVIPDEFVEGLVYLAASKIKEVEEEFEQASYYLNRSRELVGHLRSQALQTKSEKSKVRFSKNIYPDI